MKRRPDRHFLLIALNLRDTRQGMTALFERPDCAPPAGRRRGSQDRLDAGRI